ncbi:hypothetical protein ACWGDX_32530 [Streptomyces sp. NPDC055025]
MSSTGSPGSGEVGGNAPQVPWWKRPALVTAYGVVAAAVIGGWLTQGGIEVFSAAFGGEEPNKPVLTVGANDAVFCSTWLLSKEPNFFAQKLRSDLRGVDPFGDQMDSVLEKSKNSTGSQVPTGNRVDVTIEGKKEQVVILEGLKPNIVKKSTLGDLATVGDQCGGGFPARFFKTDLDAPRPKFEIADVDDEGNLISKPIDFPYRVSSSEPEKFVLMGQTEGVVEWTATLYWVADGKAGNVEIDDDGKPFVSFPETVVKYFFNTRTKNLDINP